MLKNGAIETRGKGIPPAVRCERADRAVMAEIVETEWRPDAWDQGERGWLMVGHSKMMSWVGPWVWSG
jgi:hypothetical protein